MQTKKLSLANIQSKMSRAEMKNVNGGVFSEIDDGDRTKCTSDADCTKHKGGRCYTEPGASDKTCHYAGGSVEE